MIKHKRVLPAVFIFSLLFFAGEVAGQSGGDRQSQSPNPDPVIPKEPGWKDPSYRGWEVMGITGLISTYYDLDLDGKLDYMVIRKIIRKAAAEEVSVEQAIEIAQFDGLTVYFSHPVIYFTNGHPMFYCLELDFRRNCRDMWVDVAEDGLNGNEELYTLSTPSLGVR